MTILYVGKYLRTTGQTNTDADILTVHCDNTSSEVMNAGFLTPQVIQPYSLSAKDLVMVSYRTGVNWFSVSIDSGGIITLSPNSIINSSPNDLNVSGETISLTAGENVVFGDICYIKSDGKMWKADANASGKFPAQFMAASIIAADATGIFFVKGIARNDAWTLTLGGALYLSTTAGGITQTAPSSTNDCIQVLGFALSATNILFNPSPDYITHT